VFPQAVLGGLALRVQQIVAGLLLVGGIWLASRLFRRVADRWLARRRVQRQLALVLSRVITLTLVGLVVYVLAASIFADVSTALWGVIAAALIASLGLQDLFRSYVSGFYVLLERNVRVGDEVETQGYRGTVTDVRMRVTYLRGEDGKLIVIPNAELFSQVVVVSAPEGTPPAANRPQQEAGDAQLPERAQHDPD
jgi:small conductance mechanosensitive channel